MGNICVHIEFNIIKWDIILFQQTIKCLSNFLMFNLSP